MAVRRKRNARLVRLASGGLLSCLLISGIAFAGCGGSGRSAQAVCDVWDTQAVPLGEHYQQEAKSKQFSLQDLAGVVTLPSTLANLMANLAAVAPEPIEGDFQQLQQAFQKEESSVGHAASDPLGAIASGIVSGLEAVGAYKQVNTYLRTNCGPGAQGQ